MAPINFLATTLFALASLPSLTSACGCEYESYEFHVVKVDAKEIQEPSPDVVVPHVITLQQKTGVSPSYNYVHALLNRPVISDTSPSENPIGAPPGRQSNSTNGPFRPGAVAGGFFNTSDPLDPSRSNSAILPQSSGSGAASDFTYTPTGTATPSLSSDSSLSSTDGSSAVNATLSVSSTGSSGLPPSTSVPSTTGSATSSSASSTATVRVGNQEIDLIQVGKAQGLIFAVEAVIGGTAYELVIDTGSSDTWVVNKNFQCAKPGTGDYLPQERCKFGPLFAGSSSFKAIDDLNFHIAYSDGESLTGIFGTDTVRIGGIDVKNQQIALANLAAWNGDGVTSGLLGLAFPGATKAFTGNDFRQDSAANQKIYDPIFTTMYKNEGIAPVFSIALDRNLGGVIAFGGLPDVPYTKRFASAPMQMLTTSSSSIQGSSSNSVYTLYTITTNGLKYTNAASTQWSYDNYPNPFAAPTDASQLQVIVDSGQSLIYLPEGTADAVNNLFTPAPLYKTNSGRYVVNCNSRAPEFGVKIGDQTFYVNGTDMVINLGSTCISAVAATGSGGISVLGHPFLKNVLAVFDVGAQQMRFAAREAY